MLAIPHTAYYLFHILFVAPLFLYVGMARKDVPDSIFLLLGLMAAGMFLYHAYQAYTKLSEGKSAWVNWIHIFLIVPILALLARYKKEASRRYFEMLLLLGFSALGYHGLYLIRETILA
jgi:hypothetical protein